MDRCKKCLYPSNHPFGIEFTDGVCSGCITHKEKDTLDWGFRRKQLEVILSKFKTQNRKYDCVVPVVGDAEDYYTISLVLDLGLSPLVVSVNDYFKNDIGWHNIHNLITHFDLDSVIYNPNMNVYKELVRTSLRKFNHILLPFLQLHTAFPIHVALDKKIPLIIWGQHQSIEQVGKFSHTDEVEMSKWSRREHDLFNVEIDELIGNGAQINTRDLNYYAYPDINALKGLVGIYLSNYIRWDPIIQNSGVKAYGFMPEQNISTFDTFERSGNSVYYRLHDLLKMQRVGYRRVDDHVAREIRHGRLSLPQALNYRKKIDDNRVFVKPFFDWLEISRTGYDWYLMHRMHDVKKYVCDSFDSEVDMGAPNAVLSDFKIDSKGSKKHYICFSKGI